MKPKYSDYSIHYRDMNPEQVQRARDSLVKRIESFRLRLDLEKIVPRIRGPRVLDFPIGTGRFYPHLLGRFEVYGYDISGPYIALAKRSHLDIADRFAVCSFEEINDKGEFDTVVTLRALNNIHDLERAVRNISSIIKPGGRWIFNFPPTHERVSDLPCILAESGLLVIERMTYDLHAGNRSFGRIGAAVYARFLGLIERGLIPYAVYRIVESLFACHGTFLFICEKRRP